MIVFDPRADSVLRAAMSRNLERHLDEIRCNTTFSSGEVVISKRVHSLSKDWPEVMPARRDEHYKDLPDWIVGAEVTEVVDQFVWGTYIPTELLKKMIFKTPDLQFALAVKDQSVVVDKAMWLSPSPKRRVSWTPS